MFNTQVLPLVVVPLAEGTVLTIQGPAAITKRITLENLDSSNTLTYKWQWTDDGISWTDVAPFATIAPGAAPVHADLTAHIRHRLRAYGDLNIAVYAFARVADTTTLSFVAI